MLVIAFAFALVMAIPGSMGFAKLPAELLLPIVSNIGSYNDLIAFNMTSKAVFPLIRPIFDFATACQIPSNEVWTNHNLEVETDPIIDLNRCAAHLMRFSYLYQTIVFEGHPNYVTALFELITDPLETIVDVKFRRRSLNSQNLNEFIVSIGAGWINLYLYRQVINEAMVNLLARAIDRRFTPQSRIQGIIFDVMNQRIPGIFFGNFFESLPFSDLRRLSITGGLNMHFVLKLATAMPKSQLTSFEYYIVYGSSNELQVLGSALVLTPTLKRVSFRFAQPSNSILEGMIPGLNGSRLEELEIIHGSNMDFSVALITQLPPSLKILNLSGNLISNEVVVHLFSVISRSNLKSINLNYNNAQLNSSHVQQITDSILASHLTSINLAENGIDAECDAILETARVGRTINITPRR